METWRFRQALEFYDFSYFYASLPWFLGLDISSWSILFGSRGPRRKVRLRVGDVTVIDWPWRPRRKPYGNLVCKTQLVSLPLSFFTAFFMNVESPRRNNWREKFVTLMSPLFPGSEFQWTIMYRMILIPTMLHFAVARIIVYLSNTWDKNLTASKC